MNLTFEWHIQLRKRYIYIKNNSFFYPHRIWHLNLPSLWINNCLCLQLAHRKYKYFLVYSIVNKIKIWFIVRYQVNAAKTCLSILCKCWKRKLGRKEKWRNKSRSTATKLDLYFPHETRSWIDKTNTIQNSVRYNRTVIFTGKTGTNRPPPSYDFTLIFNLGFSEFISMQI